MEAAERAERSPPEPHERSVRGPELDAFLGAIKHGGESPCSVGDARAALVVALAADRSLREHRPVRVGEFA